MKILISVRQVLLCAIFSLLMVGALPAQEFKEKDVVRGDLGKKIDKILRTSEERGNKFTGSVLVYKEGEIKLAKGYGKANKKEGTDNTRHTLFDIASVAKQFTAAAVLKLEMMGKVSVDDSISKYFEDVPEEKKAVTIHHMLTHTSGLVSSLSRSAFKKFDFSSVDPLIDYALEKPLQHEPGKEFHYNNLVYIMLAGLVQKVSGTSFDQFLKEKLWKPAGMKYTGFPQDGELPEKHAAVGYMGKRTFGPVTQMDYGWDSRGCTAIVSNVDDLLRWFVALQGEKVLSKEAKKKYFTPFKNDYAYGWYVEENPRGETIIRHSGGTRGFESRYRWFKDRNAMLIVLSNQPGDVNIILSEVVNELSPLVGILRVTGVQPGGPADKAGIKKGDEIVSYNGKEMDTVQDLIREKNNIDEEEKVPVVIKRDGEKKELKISPGRLGVRLRAE